MSWLFNQNSLFSSVNYSEDEESEIVKDYDEAKNEIEGVKDEGETALSDKGRYLQLAFNGSLSSALSVISSIPKSSRILIEAGTPFIKKEGMAGIEGLARYWDGYIVADLKVSDGAAREVRMAKEAGASAVTALGSAPIETLKIFIKECNEHNVDSMIDMINVEDPLRVLMKLGDQPDVVILHKGRDEESTRGKVIPYKHINKIRSKFSVLISAAGGVDLREADSAIFNGANIVVVNIVDSNDSWKGISSNDDLNEIANKFLETIRA